MGALGLGLIEFWLRFDSVFGLVGFKKEEQMRLLLDTNIVVDYVLNRQEENQKYELLFSLIKIGELDAWISCSQLTDILYILSQGGKKHLSDQAAQIVENLLEHINVYPLQKSEIIRALRSSWQDNEDACIYQCAKSLKADYIISNNKKDFSKSRIAVAQVDEFFLALERAGINFDWVNL